MNLVHIPHFAILSGVFGTAASVFGKLISHIDELIEDIPINADQTVNYLHLSNYGDQI